MAVNLPLYLCWQGRLFSTPGFLCKLDTPALCSAFVEIQRKAALPERGWCFVTEGDSQMRRRGRIGLVSGSGRGKIRSKLCWGWAVCIYRSRRLGGPWRVARRCGNSRGREERREGIFVLGLEQQLFNVESSRPRALKEGIAPRVSAKMTEKNWKSLGQELQERVARCHLRGCGVRFKHRRVAAVCQTRRCPRGTAWCNQPRVAAGELPGK